MSAEFIDTNVLTYAYDSGDRDKHRIAVELMTRLAGERIGILSTQVIVEFFWVATSKFRMKSEEAEHAIQALFLWPIHRPTHSDVISAIHLQRRHKLSWWDAMIVNSAIESEASVLWTEDLNDGQRFGKLTVRNPFKSARG